MATRGTAAALQEAGVQAETVLKIQEGRPNAADLMKARAAGSFKPINVETVSAPVVGSVAATG